jgi:crotonobetainyl-CoA:carnitine CoA-transferase CaiB-like acyl-CoA transferase
MARFDATGVPASPLNFAEDMSDDPQVVAEGLMVDLVHAVTGPQRVTGPLVLMSGTPTAVTRPAPALGQHSREVLHEYGLADDDIQTLVRAGVVVQSAHE